MGYNLIRKGLDPFKVTDRKLSWVLDVEFYRMYFMRIKLLKEWNAAIFQTSSDELLS